MYLLISLKLHFCCNLFIWFFLCFSSNKRRIRKTKYTQTLHKNSFSTNGCCFSTIVFHDSTQKSMESFKQLLKSVVVVRSGDLYGRFDSLRSFLELDLICFSHSVQVTQYLDDSSVDDAEFVRDFVLQLALLFFKNQLLHIQKHGLHGMLDLRGIS